MGTFGLEQEHFCAFVAKGKFVCYDEKMSTENLYDKLISYSKSEAYPFHMPGHKRQLLSMEDPYRFDLTEIDGFDNLHDAEDILLREQERVARLYGAEESYFMVNGSTGGLLSAIAGVCHRGDRVLVARNCHTSVYHALELNGLRPVYIWPDMDETLGIYRGLRRENVETLLEKHSDIKAVIFTSPTYEGMFSDVKEICEAAHERGIPCIVDEAHGSHLRWIGFEDAIACGADVVVQSLHKTMPALTQTALLHIQGNLVSKMRIRKMLATYQTSSPSYVLMASMSLCMSWLEKEGKAAFEAYKQMACEYRKRLGRLKHLCLYEPDLYEPDLYETEAGELQTGGGQPFFDWGKFVIGTQRASMNGRQLYDRLRDEFHLQMEMVCAEHVLAMTTVGDSEDGFERLAKSLEQIDEELEQIDAVQEQKTFDLNLCPPERLMEIDEAVDFETEEVPLVQAEGRIIGDYIYLYPPGIPLVVPGEVLGKEQMKQIQYFERQGLSVHGGYIKEKKDVKVILHHGEKCIR